MSVLEIIAVIFSLGCVVLSIKKHILCWPIGIIGIVAYGILFAQERLFAEMTLQIIFLYQMIFGWIQWNKNTKEFKIINIDNADFLFHIMASIGIIVLTIVVLSQFFNSSQPILDSTTAVISLLANYYLAKKIIQSWHLWIFVDVLFIGMFITQGLYLSSLLYIIFFIMAIFGLMSWKKSMNK